MEELLGAVGADEVAEIPGERSFWIDRQCFQGGSEEGEWEQPPPDLAADAPRLRILRGPQPQRVTHARPCERPLFLPDHDECEYDYPNEARVEANQQPFGKRLTAAELIAEPRSHDPGENPHRDTRCRPQRKNPRE